MTSRPRGVWHLLLLGLLGVAIVVAAVIEIGPPSSSARTSRQVVTAERGVVQSTVSGSGNIEPGTQVTANFKASGTLSNLYVKVGQHVHQGQLLATLDPTSAQLAVEEAQLNLTAAEDQLTAVENGTSTGSSSTSGSGSGTSSDASTPVAASSEFVSDVSAATTPTTSTPTTPTQTTTTVTVPARTTPQRSQSTPSSQSGTRSTSSSSSGTGGSSRSSSGTSSTTTPSPASIASAEASVDSARLSLRNAQTALDETRLYAPDSGTVVSLETTTPGDLITGSSGSSSSSASSSGGSGSSGSGSTGSGSTGSGSTGSGSSGSGSSGSTGSSGSGSSGSGSTGSASTSSSSSGFAEIVNTSSMTMTVAFSESDISKIKDGQAATVTPDALSGVELAAHVSSISTLGTTSNSVVSYDATITLDQSDSRIKPGMSASASVLTSQASGVTLPNSAITGSGSLSSVNVLKNGKEVATPVAVGLKGDSRTQIVSGIKPGAEVVVTTTLPALGSSSSAASSGSSTLGGLRSRFGGGGLGGGGGFGGGGGAARLFGGGAP